MATDWTPKRDTNGRIKKGQAPWNKGLKASKKHKKNSSEAHKGYVTPEETKKKISKAVKNNLPSTAFKKGQTSAFKGKHHSEESLKKISKNNARYFLGKKRSEETRKKLSESAKGRRLSEETKRKLSEAHKGEKSHCWRGGKSFEPYGLEFNKELKERIRERDSFRCQQCFRHQDELFINTKAGIRPRKLDVHHIDYNKQNNQEENLVALCMSCHMQTNYSREDWTNYFEGRAEA